MGCCAWLVGLLAYSAYISAECASPSSFKKKIYLDIPKDRRRISFGKKLGSQAVTTDRL
jgi:hypothetical protein